MSPDQLNYESEQEYGTAQRGVTSEPWSPKTRLGIIEYTKYIPAFLPPFLFLAFRQPGVHSAQEGDIVSNALNWLATPENRVLAASIVSTMTSVFRFKDVISAGILKTPHIVLPLLIMDICQSVSVEIAAEAVWFKGLIHFNEPLFWEIPLGGFAIRPLAERTIIFLNKLFSGRE